MIKVKINPNIVPEEDRPVSCYKVVIEYMYGDGDNYVDKEAWFKREDVMLEFLKYVDNCMLAHNNNEYDWDQAPSNQGYLDAIWNYDWYSGVFTMDDAQFTGFNYEKLLENYGVSEDDIPELFKKAEFWKDIECLDDGGYISSKFIEGLGIGAPINVEVFYYDENGSIHETNLSGLKSHPHCYECSKYKTKDCPFSDRMERDPNKSCNRGRLKEDE